MMRKMVLYDIESLPADINGDGVIEANFQVAGRDTGRERFNAEWLFRTPLQIQGPIGASGGLDVISYAGTNISQAYCETLEFRIDSDGDGWPDVWDAAPRHPGLPQWRELTRAAGLARAAIPTLTEARGAPS